MCVQEEPITNSFFLASRTFGYRHMDEEEEEIKGCKITFENKISLRHEGK